MTTAIPTLRPLRMGQILDQAIRIYRRNFVKFVGIIAVVQVPLTLLQMGSTLLTLNGLNTLLDISGRSNGPDAGYYLGLLGSIVTSILSFVLVYGIAAAAIARAVVGQYVGESITFVGAYRRIAGSVPRLIGAVLFVVVLALGVGIWTIVPCIGWLTGPGLLMFFLAAILPLVAPAIVIEGKPAVGAVRRAWDLVRRRFWWVVGFVIILYLFGQLIVSGPGILVTILLQAGAGRLYDSGNSSNIFLVQTVIQSLASLILGLLYMPLQFSCLTLMYVDLRVRTEGFDLAVQAAQALPAEGEAATVLAQAPPPGTGNLITWQEVGYFALISLGTVALIGLLYVAVFGIILLTLAGST